MGSKSTPRRAVQAVRPYHAARADLASPLTEPANTSSAWIEFGGADPTAVLRQYAGRCPWIHLKDRTAGPTSTYAEVGERIVDFAPIFAAAEAGSAEWYIAEQDWTARPPLEAAALSLKHLTEWGKL